MLSLSKCSRFLCWQSLMGCHCLVCPYVRNHMYISSITVAEQQWIEKLKEPKWTDKTWIAWIWQAEDVQLTALFFKSDVTSTHEERRDFPGKFDSIRSLSSPEELQKTKSAAAEQNRLKNCDSALNFTSNTKPSPGRVRQVPKKKGIFNLLDVVVGAFLHGS